MERTSERAPERRTLFLDNAVIETLDTIRLDAARHEGKRRRSRSALVELAVWWLQATITQGDDVASVEQEVYGPSDAAVTDDE